MTITYVVTFHPAHRTNLCHDIAAKATLVDAMMHICTVKASLRSRCHIEKRIANKLGETIYTEQVL